MKSNADVVYRDLDTSPALNDIIERKLEKLSRYSNTILHSRVVLDSPHKHKHKGKMFRATIELNVNGEPVAVSQNDESVHVAVRDAFSVAERKLKQCSEKRRMVHH